MTALAVIKFPYDWEKNIDLERVKKCFPRLFDNDGKPRSNWEIGDYAVDSLEIALLSDIGIEISIKKFKGLIPIGAGSEFPNAQAVHIHAPNNALINFKKVKLREDCCTDLLQSDLDDGWRIIAICPPINARRPDYILGKVDGDEES